MKMPFSSFSFIQLLNIRSKSVYIIQLKSRDIFVVVKYSCSRLV